MSSPRFLNNIEEVMSAAQAHGLLTRKTASGHWQVLEDRTGLGRHRVLATFPGTGTVSKRLTKNEIARIRRLVGIDIRQPAPRKPKQPVQQEELRVLGPPTPPPQPGDPLTAETLRAAVRWAMTDLLQELVRALSPPPRPAAVPQAEEKQPELVKLRKPRVMLTEQQVKEMLALYEAGESMQEITRTYNVSTETGYRYLRMAGLKTHKATQL